MAYDRHWLEEVGSEDAHGRTVWALGEALGSEDLRGPALRLFDAALPVTASFTSPRAAAFTMLGLGEYLKNYPGDLRARSIGDRLANWLIELFLRHARADWRWFEDIVAYDNAVLPMALIRASEWCTEANASTVALDALSWLCELQTGREGRFSPIGSNGFYRHGGERAMFDQQPVEALSTVLACAAAFDETRDVRWRDEAERAFAWFLGQNELGLSVYDPVSGGCRDGMHIDRLNQNQGAESTLAYLLSAVEIRRLRREKHQQHELSYEKQLLPTIAASIPQ